MCSVIRTLSRVSQLVQIANALFHLLRLWKRDLVCWQYLTSRPQDNGPYLLTFNLSWRYGTCGMSTGYADAAE